MIHVLAASGHMSPAAARFLAWAVLAAIAAILLIGLLRILGVGK